MHSLPHEAAALARSLCVLLGSMCHSYLLSWLWLAVVYAVSYAEDRFLRSGASPHGQTSWGGIRVAPCLLSIRLRYVATGYRGRVALVVRRTDPLGNPARIRTDSALTRPTAFMAETWVYVSRSFPADDCQQDQSHRHRESRGDSGLCAIWPLLVTLSVVALELSQ